MVRNPSQNTLRLTLPTEIKGADLLARYTEYEIGTHYDYARYNCFSEQKSKLREHVLTSSLVWLRIEKDSLSDLSTQISSNKQEWTLAPGESATFGAYGLKGDPEFSARYKGFYAPALPSETTRLANCQAECDVRGSVPFMCGSGGGFMMTAACVAYFETCMSKCQRTPSTDCDACAMLEAQARAERAPIGAGFCTSGWKNAQVKVPVLTGLESQSLQFRLADPSFRKGWVGYNPRSAEELPVLNGLDLFPAELTTEWK